MGVSCTACYTKEQQLGFGKAFEYCARVLRSKKGETGQLFVVERKKRWLAASSRLQYATVCPFSIYAAFAPYKSLGGYGNLFCRSFKTAWLTYEDNREYFPKRPPF